MRKGKKVLQKNWVLFKKYTTSNEIFKVKGFPFVGQKEVDKEDLLLQMKIWIEWYTFASLYSVTA